MSDIPLEQIKAQHPTCKTCRHWRKPLKIWGSISQRCCEEPKMNSYRYTRATAAIQMPEKNAEHRIFGRVGVGLLMTGPDYYCPHWEAKS